jgi:hypothetical protein
MRVRPPALASAAVCCLLSFARGDVSHRLFDFTPISAANPVVATIDGTLQIPLSELRAYRTTERLQARTDDLPRQRALLDDLINEYLFVDEAYRTGLVQSPKFSTQMAATRTMILTDFLSTQATNEHPPGSVAARDAAATLADRLFDAAPIDISNEAYALIKRAAQKIDTTSAASQRGPVADPPDVTAAKLSAIITATPEAVAVRFADKSLSLHEILSIYAGLPAPRPAVQTPEGFVALIKPLITPELMAGEAVRRGIASESDFQNKLVQNRNALLRFQAQAAIEAEANAILRSPELEAKLQAWYRTHAGTYAVTEPGGGRTVPALAEARDRALADFSVELCDHFRAEKARALRQARVITIDEAVLRTL